MKTIDTEICILGGGPAGSVIARQLARLGHDVLMVDRGFQEGRLRAESLAPSIVPILDSLQLGAAVEAAVFARESRALLSWEGGSIQEKWFVKGPFILVERPRLDAIFRRAAAEAGACILHPALGRRPQQVFRGGWRIEIVTANGGINVATRFLVDARGKRRRGNWSTRDSVRTAALSAIWQTGGPLTETRIEAGSDEWFWGSPLPRNQYMATIFLDPKRVGGLSTNRRADIVRFLISRTKLLRTLECEEMIHPPTVRDASASIATDLIGTNFIRVGEAAVAIDPLASQGIQRAIISAIQGSAAVHTLLSESSDQALEFYCGRQQDASLQASQHAARLYALCAATERNSFWQRRAHAAQEGPIAVPPKSSARIALPPNVCLSPAVRIVEVAVLSGNRVSRARALSHPDLEHPVAYLSGEPLAPLVGEAIGAKPVEQILCRWAMRMPIERARAIARWMYQVGILIPFGSRMNSGDRSRTNGCAGYLRSAGPPHPMRASELRCR
jgi:flavin-dependent dehydrogenase